MRCSIIQLVCLGSTSSRIAVQVGALPACDAGVLVGFFTVLRGGKRIAVRSTCLLVPVCARYLGPSWCAAGMRCWSACMAPPGTLRQQGHAHFALLACLCSSVPHYLDPDTECQVDPLPKST
ncbi:hypothetical protein EJ06DRAFT_352715 [Trichodelitschia bisporula]|uniref:Uncharacterized protein n=1 Tax=Trichodelitschia bisporula TaxID=703511 RepID=A0A6G1I0M1_9PEZI|nr:hypothetical protein EJ06DRAFT_352715 [Trichodelitschia bisporula]